MTDQSKLGRDGAERDAGPRAPSQRRAGAASIARSSVAEMERRHCPAAARRAELDEYRDRRGMDVGTSGHHLLFAVATREDGVTETQAVEQMAAQLGAGRRFEGGKPEYPRLGDIDTAMGLVLDKLDSDPIPARDSVDQMWAELKVGLDRDFRKCDLEACRCDKSTAGVHRRSGGCQPFRPVAIWTGTVDLAYIAREEIDDEELTVIQIKDWKGGNVTGWTKTLQAKGAVLIAQALCPEAAIIRVRAESYFPWGGYDEMEIDLRQEDDINRLEDFRRSIEVAVRAHAARQGKHPDELAAPGAGCSAGYNGEPCPFIMKCKPFWEDWAKFEAAADALEEKPDAMDATFWASLWTRARAVQALAGGRVKAAIADMPGSKDGDLYGCLETAGGSVVGWKKRGGSKVAANAPFHIAEQWVELKQRLEAGSAAAQAAAARLEAVLRVPKALGVSTVKALIKSFKEIMTLEELAAFEALCLEDAPSRTLGCWKK